MKELYKANRTFSEFDRLNVQDVDVISNALLQSLYEQYLQPLVERNICEIACGSGGTLRVLNISPTKYVGIDPSQKSIQLFRAKYPEYADCLHVLSFEESENLWSVGDSVVLATFGAANYFQRSYLEKLEKSGKDFFLMFYKEGFCPEEYKLIPYFKYSLQEMMRMFPTAEITSFDSYYIVTR